MATVDKETQAKAKEEKNKGNEAYQKKEYKDAIQHYSAAISLDPTQFTYYSNKAAALLALQDYAECLAVCEEGMRKGAIGDEEGDPRALLSKLYFRMGAAYEGLGKAKQAFHYMQHSVQTSSSPPACERMLVLSKKIVEETKKEKPKHMGSSIVRRKLNDAAMHHFLLGNTPAASVLAKDARYENLLFASDNPKKPVRFLFSGSGDARNLLTSLQHLSKILENEVHRPARELEIHMNDSNPSILARNIVLLVLASENPANKEQTEHCCAIWMNTTLCDTHYDKLISILDRLLSDKIDELFPWLKFSGNALEIMREVWHVWKHCPVSHKTVLRMRKEQMQKSPIIPYQTPDFKMWLQSGCLSFGDGGEICNKANPTLLDYVTFKFCETQGPFAAFDELQSSSNVSEKLVDKWEPLLSIFYKLLKNGSPVKPTVHIWGGDVMRISELVPEDMKFDFIDTSNLMDYLGLVNILVNLRPMLNPNNPYSCIQVENIIGASSTAQQVLQLYCKIDPRKMLMLLGLRHAEVENATGNVRMKFFIDTSKMATGTVKEPLKEFYTKISSELPFPDSPNPSMPFMMGRVLPALTVGTLVGIVELICANLSVFPTTSAAGLLDELVNGDAKMFFLRNRIFALRSLCVANGERIVPAVRNLHSLPDHSEFQHYCVPIEPIMDLSMMRGGIGEPSLAVIIFKTEALCKDAFKKQYGEATYLHLKQRTQEELQLVDNISYNIHANILQFDLLKCDLETMKEGMLAILEVEKHFIISKPVPVTKVLEGHISNVA